MFSRVYNLRHVKIVFKHKRFNKIYGQVRYIKKNEYKVELDSTMSMVDFIGTIIHEVAHIIEYMEGRSFYSHGFRFKRTEQYLIKMLR